MSKLYVGNLPRGITESALEEFFTSAQYQVQNIKLVRDMDSGLPRGFAFVELAADIDLQKAIQELKGHSMEGKQLVINEARPQTPRPGGGDRGFSSGRHHGGGSGFGGRPSRGGGGVGRGKGGRGGGRKRY
jgi:cold-inducible RNA-binding protein